MARKKINQNEDMILVYMSPGYQIMSVWNANKILGTIKHSGCVLYNYKIRKYIPYGKINKY